MKTRRLASIALVAAVLVGTTGCSMISHQATTIQYTPGEGVNAHSGDVLVRNALVVSEDGEEGNFIAGIVNESSEAQALTIEYGEGSGKTTEVIRVAAGASFTLGMTDGRDPILFTDLDTPPGADLTVYFQSGDAEGQTISVPVLDGTLAYLAPFVP